MVPVVLVTGASRGIGLHVTRILLTELNAVVVTLSRSISPELGRLLLANSKNLLVIECDLTDEKALSNAFGTITKTYGRLDSIVLNAGTLGPLQRIETGTLAEWRRCLEVNLIANVSLLALSTPYLRSSPMGGRVIFVSSGAATGNIASWGAYNTSKAALNALCRTYANEEPRIISVAFRPGLVDTDMQTKLRTDGPSTMSQAEMSRFLKAFEEKKLLNPDIPAHIIAKLSLQATQELSGNFVSYDSDECAPYRRTSNASLSTLAVNE